jgi:hypothetical protein
VNLAPIVKLVRAYDAVEWEIFISKWQKGFKGHFEVKRLGGSGDLGRDVIGLCGPEGCQGIWDNFSASITRECFRYQTPVKTLAR